MNSQAPQKRRLGRGLAALLGDEPVIAEKIQEVVVAETGSALRTVSIDQISPNPQNPRKTFKADELESLAASLKGKGLLQPLVVRPQSDGTYELVAGERRWRAAQIAQLHQVPVIVREMDDRESLEIALIENIQRSDLNALEEALGYKQLLEAYGYTQQQLAEGVGKSRSHITNTVRLLTLPKDVQSKINDGTLTAGHARTLVASEKPSDLADQIIKLGLSVREAEDLARSQPESHARTKPRKDNDTRAIEKELNELLGLSVDIAHKGEGGKVTISYKDLDQLDLVITRLKG